MPQYRAGFRSFSIHFCAATGGAAGERAIAGHAETL